MADYFEKLPPKKEVSFCPEEAIFMITELLLIFDNQKKTIKIIANTLINEQDELENLYQGAIQKIEDLINKVNEGPKNNPSLEQRR